MVAVVAVLAALSLDPALYAERGKSDVPQLTHPFGSGDAGHVADRLLTPLARWDAVWYLTIAQSGYVGTAAGQPSLPPERRAAFFPVYPYSVRAVSGFSHSPGRLLVAALLVSLAAFAGALWLLYRLTELEAGPAVARAAVFLLAFSPMAFFFSAPYAESLFLLLSVGAVYAARRERWAWAGILAGVASATRNTGVLLILPLAIMYLFPRGEPRRSLRPDAAFLLLAPVGLLAHSWHLHRSTGDWLGWAHTQESFDRQFVGPVIGFKDALADAWNSLGDLALASPTLDHFETNLVGLLFLAGAIAGTVGVFRRLGPAYGAYCVAALLWALSAPNETATLLAFPRYVTVLFPLFMWLAIVCERRRITTGVVGAFAVLLGLFTAQFATWQYVV